MFFLRVLPYNQALINQWCHPLFPQVAQHMRVLDVDDDTEFLEQQVSEAGRRGATAVSAGAVFGGVDQNN